VLAHSAEIKRNLKTVYGMKSFLSEESDTKILQSIYVADDVGIISSYSNRIMRVEGKTSVFATIR